jgi:hypothetical protein
MRAGCQPRNTHFPELTLGRRRGILVCDSRSGCLLPWYRDLRGAKGEGQDFGGVYGEGDTYTAGISEAAWRREENNPGADPPVCSHTRGTAPSLQGT